MNFQIILPMAKLAYTTTWPLSKIVHRTIFSRSVLPSGPNSLKFIVLSFWFSVRSIYSIYLLFSYYLLHTAYYIPATATVSPSPSQTLPGLPSLLACPQTLAGLFPAEYNSALHFALLTTYCLLPHFTVSGSRFSIFFSIGVPWTISPILSTTCPMPFARCSMLVIFSRVTKI